MNPAEKNPMMNIKEPHAPKRCIGRLRNRDKNQIVIRSRNPLMKRSIPNFVSPYLRAWCFTTFSPIFPYPAFFAKTGMYRCISPLTSTFFTTTFLYAFNPQLKSCSFTPDVRRAAQLKSFDGRFFVTTESYRFFFHPETRS